MPNRRALIAALALVSFNADAKEAEPEESFLLGFVVGEYALVGQYPDSTRPYSGVARIERKGDKLLLTRLIGPDRIQAEGMVEVPHPPGEGEVLRFRWGEKEPLVMTCLVKGDLDNYARLTCLWGSGAGTLQQPGIEALFPTEVWPEEAPSKQMGTAPKPRGD